MEPAAAFTILAAVLIVAVLVVYLLLIIWQLRKISSGLGVVIEGVGHIISKSAPVNDIVNDLNNNLDKGRDLLEHLLNKKAGVEDAAGLIESVFPGAGAAVLERNGRRGHVRNIDEVYSRGANQLVRLGRESPMGAAMVGEALRDPVSSSASARTIYHRPGPEDSRPRSPVIGTDAPEVYEPREDGGASGSGEESASGEESGSSEESAPNPPPSG